MCSLPTQAFIQSAAQHSELLVCRRRVMEIRTQMSQLEAELVHVASQEVTLEAQFAAQGAAATGGCRDLRQVPPPTAAAKPWVNRASALST